MGCGCGGKKRELNKPTLQKPQAPPVIPERVQPPPQVHHEPNVVQVLASGPAVLEVKVVAPPVAPRPLPPPPAPQQPRQVITSNADAIREALRKRREQQMAARLGNKPRQY